ncbi:bifunctional biotin--[acetyl-CoA-carboxylase] ligase/biotin operon repressor BirA [Thalassolituus sp. UBA2590]|uniref:bifunctional biotin--[acetyl-CoA-carboxylase] ligase/biotin operon repressor BirA n=1 Tax=Thalassolituus sp. UBA2590 TaxID=1947663 RepID=UPI002648DE5B|nr:bifunctional biotin--[acetyl-CoA-carboxylase] ligase/biotin operon repressor BirA [Thalassolituus sp. UBA2590]
MLKKLLRHLSDGHFHSGEALGEAMGVSRAAVWKQLKKLEELEVPFSSVKGKGYRLHDPIELLDEDAIRSVVSQRLDCLELLLEVNSTNTYLFERASDHMGKRYAVLAEKQSSGRGRRGRQWISPFGRNIYLSLLVSFSGGMSALEGLSLTVGVAVEKALSRLGIDGVGLKWPNDVYADGRKLAGILLEVTGEYNSHCQVVIGIGLNLSMSEAEARDIDQPWVDLKSLKPDLSRNQVAGVLLDELLSSIDTFQREGFAPLQEYWSQKDIYHDKDVVISSPTQQISGTVKGVNRKGELMLRTERGMEIISAGELSVRPVS